MYVGYICLLMFISVYISVLARSSTVIDGHIALGLDFADALPFLGMNSVRAVDIVTYHSRDICLVWFIAG